MACHAMRGRAGRLALCSLAVWIVLGSMVTGCSNDPASTGIPPEPTFSAIQQEIFAKSCAFSSCHGADGQRGGLVLEGNNVYDALVGVRPEDTTARGLGFLRVMPGKPDSSFLLRKVVGPGPGEGTRMPDGLGALEQTSIDAIREWIRRGAHRD